MIIDRTFTCSANTSEIIAVEFPDVDGTFEQIPTAAKCVADNLISALEELGVLMTYDEETFEAQIGDAKFFLVYGIDGLYLVGNSKVCEVGMYNHVDNDVFTSEISICVRGTSQSFEVVVGVGEFFGIYTVQRVFDEKNLTAIRTNTTDGFMMVYEDGIFVEGLDAVVPKFSNHGHQNIVRGVVMVPAVSSSFDYEILDAYMYIPFLNSGTYYEIAGVSVVAVQECILLVC